MNKTLAFFLRQVMFFFAWMSGFKFSISKESFAAGLVGASICLLLLTVFPTED